MTACTVGNHLAAIGYFQGLTHEQLTPLVLATHQVHYPAQTPIFMEGDPLTAVYAVITGQVKSYKLSKEGKELILHLVSPGDTFAEFPFFMGLHAYPTNAMSLVPSELLVMDGAAFQRFVIQQPDVLQRVLTRLAGRLKDLNSLASDLGLRSIESRLAKYLLTLSPDDPTSAIMDINKKTLAALLGTVPETLSRAFAKLAQEDLITLQGNTVELRNRPALVRLAGLEMT